MKKTVYIVSFLLMHLFSLGQTVVTDTIIPPKNFSVKVLIGGGLNGPYYSTTDNLPYGIRNSIKNGGVGAIGQIGFGLDIKHKVGVEFLVGGSSASSRYHHFLNSLEAEFPDSYLHGDLNLDVTHSGHGNNYIGYYSSNIYYVFDRIKEWKIVGLGGVYYARPVNMSYQFVTHEPQTNYYTRHQISSENKNRFLFYNIGFEIRKYIIGIGQNNNRANQMHLGLRVNSIIGKYDAYYSIYHTDYAGVETMEQVVAPIKLFHLNVSLNLCILTF